MKRKRVTADPPPIYTGENAITLVHKGHEFVVDLELMRKRSKLIAAFDTEASAVELTVDCEPQDLHTLLSLIHHPGEVELPRKRIFGILMACQYLDTDETGVVETMMNLPRSPTTINHACDILSQRRPRANTLLFKWCIDQIHMGLMDMLSVCRSVSIKRLPKLPRFTPQVLLACLCKWSGTECKPIAEQVQIETKFVRVGVSEASNSVRTEDSKSLDDSEGSDKENLESRENIEGLEDNKIIIDAENKTFEFDSVVFRSFVDLRPGRYVLQCNVEFPPDTWATVFSFVYNPTRVAAESIHTRFAMRSIGMKTVEFDKRILSGGNPISNYHDTFKCDPSIVSLARLVNLDDPLLLWMCAQLVHPVVATPPVIAGCAAIFISRKHKRIPFNVLANIRGRLTA
jgi:hypothetical protein